MGLQSRHMIATCVGVWVLATAVTVRAAPLTAATVRYVTLFNGEEQPDV